MATCSSALGSGGHQVVAFDPRVEAAEAVVQQSAVGASSLEELIGKLSASRSVWVMVPASQPTEDTVNTVADLMSGGETTIDGGNFNHKDSVDRAAALKERGLFFVDVGTSGGIWGMMEGYSMMIGGDRDAFGRLPFDHRSFFEH